MSVTTEFLHPDMCWLRRALLMCLLTHPVVSTAEVYLPSKVGQKKTLVPIVRGRLFGGPELIEPGLTLAVYPYHSNYDVTKGSLPDVNGNKSVVYPVKNTAGEWYTTLGSNRGPIERGHHACIKLVVQLFYREASYNLPFQAQAEYVREEDYERSYFGYYFQYDDILNENEVSLADKLLDKSVLVNKIDVQMLPAEEVLTQWLDLLKYALRDIKVLRPYNNIRNPQVLFTDYPTSNWSSKDPNLVFHTAYHVVSFDVSEPPIPPTKTYPNVQSILLTTP